MKKIALAVAAAFIVGAFTGVQAAEDRDASKYVGTKKCKMCHKKEEVGAQFAKWEEGPHAKAFATLGSDKAKEVGKKLGIDDPQKSGKCLKCHSTAYNWTEEVQTDKFDVEEGVSCESCHGPGEDYKKKEIMKDRETAIAGGMVHPALEKSCTMCHNKDNPTHADSEYNKPDGTFDAVKAYEEIKHERPK